jgi:hypothetical protein
MANASHIWLRQSRDSVATGAAVVQRKCMPPMYRGHALTLSKMRRAPFLTSRSMSSAPLQLLQTDLAWPYLLATPEGGRYNMAVLYDFSKFCWVHVLRAKSDTAEQLITQCETGFTPCHVQRVRSVEGGEFEGHRLLDFYRSKGITLVTMVGYVP